MGERCVYNKIIIMRILDSNEYINEKLAIQPVTKDRLSKFREEHYIDEKSRQFTESNNLIWNPKTMCYDCEGDVIVLEDIVINGKLKIRFGKVGGGFYCTNINLTTLEGAPQEVGRDFSCRDNKLTSLEGAPQKVSGNFYCYNNKLTTLEGAPNEVCGDFSCIGNNLTNLEGAPSMVGGDFYCNDNELTSLECATQKVGGNFNCSRNSLTSLEGAPSMVGGNFYCSDNPNLILPENKPSWLKGDIIN